MRTKRHHQMAGEWGRVVKKAEINAKQKIGKRGKKARETVERRKKERNIRGDLLYIYICLYIDIVQVCMYIYRRVYKAFAICRILSKPCSSRDNNNGKVDLRLGIRLRKRGFTPLSLPLRVPRLCSPSPEKRRTAATGMGGRRRTSTRGKNVGEENEKRYSAQPFCCI